MSCSEIGCRQRDGRVEIDDDTGLAEGGKFGFIFYMYCDSHIDRESVRK